MSTGVYNGLQGKLNTGDITGTLYGSYLFNESPNNFGARFTSQFTPASASGNFFTAQAENGGGKDSLKYSAGGTATTSAVTYAPGATNMAISK